MLIFFIVMWFPGIPLPRKALPLNWEQLQGGLPGARARSSGLWVLPRSDMLPRGSGAVTVAQGPHHDMSVKLHTFTGPVNAIVLCTLSGLPKPKDCTLQTRKLRAKTLYGN